MQILNTKFHIPAPDQGTLVQRQSLVKFMSDADGKGLVLIQAPAGFGKTTFLVLDDFHLISERLIHDGINFLIDHPIDNLLIIIATRNAPPLGLARLRISGRLKEIDETQLRFSREETIDLIACFLPGPMTNEALDILTQQTESWVAALKLAMLSFQGLPPLLLYAMQNSLNPSHKPLSSRQVRVQNFEEDFNARELDILKLFQQGVSNKEAANTLNLSVNTVRWYASRLFAKLSVKRRGQAVTEAVRLGLI